MSDNISVLSHYTTSGSTNVSDQIDFDNINLSFNGCGFLGIYHVGVASALQYYLPNMNVKNICGASAGAWGAAAFIAGMPLDEMTSDLMTAAMKIRQTFLGAFNPSTDAIEHLVRGLEKHLPDNIHEVATGKLHISSTDIYTGQNRLINNFQSKKEVVDAIWGSTFIPGFSGTLPARFRHRRCIDGGFSVNQVILEDQSSATLTVSPFSGDAHICPKNRKNDIQLARMAGANAEVDVSLDNMIRMHYVLCPQSPEKMSEILMQGYHDAVAFLTKHGQIRHACGKCLTVKTTFSPQDVLKEEQARKRKHTLTGEEVSSQFPEALVKSIQRIDEMPDRILSEDRWKFAGIPLPTMKEIVFDYNPWYRTFEFCMKCYKKCLVCSYNLLHQNCKYVPEPNDLLHFCEESVSKFIGMIGYVGPKWFGVRVTKVDNAEKSVTSKRKSKFSCDFHITQDVDSDEEIDGDSEHSHTLMSAQFEIEIDQKGKPKNHRDAMRLQAENLEQAAQSNYTSRVTSRITSVAPSLVASALQSRNTSRTMSRVPSRASMMSTPPSPVSGRRSTNGISRCLSSNNVIGSPQTTTRGSASVSRRNSLPGAFLNPTEAIHDNIDDYESSPETLENLIRVTQQEKSVLQTYYTDDNGDIVTLSVYDISETDPTDILGNDIIEQNLQLEERFDFECDNDDFDVAVARRLERLRRRSGQRSGDSYNSLDFKTAPQSLQSPQSFQ